LKCKKTFLAFSSFSSPLSRLNALCGEQLWFSHGGGLAGMDGWLRKSNHYAFLYSQVFESLYVLSMATILLDT